MTSATEKALQAIAAGAYVCEACGVEYVEGYVGPCQEPHERATFADGRWSRMCTGTVSAAGTARRGLGVTEAK